MTKEVTKPQTKHTDRMVP